MIHMMATITPSDPIIDSKIYISRTDKFYVQSFYPSKFQIQANYDTFEYQKGQSGLLDGPEVPEMIGDFALHSYHDDGYDEMITEDNPVTLGERIYNKIT